MITTAQEYFANLDLIQNINQPAYALLPNSENIYNVNINTREVEAPEFLSIEKDLRAETIYFSVDRYADYMDLSETCCVIKYNNANKNQGTRYYPVPFYDIYKFYKQKKMIFPWVLDSTVTNTPGPIEFSINFFKFIDKVTERNDVSKELIYNLNTLPATSKVLTSINEKQIASDSEYILKDSQYYQLLDQIQSVSNLQKLYWTILDDSFTEPIIDKSSIQDKLDDIIK